jgi:hypothetical protein
MLGTDVLQIWHFFLQAIGNCIKVCMLFVASAFYKPKLNHTVHRLWFPKGC